MEDIFKQHIEDLKDHALNLWSINTTERSYLDALTEIHILIQEARTLYNNNKSGDSKLQDALIKIADQAGVTRWHKKIETT